MAAEDEQHPWTKGRLVEHLEQLGVLPGETLLVQSSLRSIGRIEGGARTLMEALLTVLGESGTLVVYTASPENSDTSRLALALTEGMTAGQKSAHQAAMAPYDPAGTPTTPLLGWFSEVVRAHPEAVRSGHPQTSFTAVGRNAARLMARHDLHSHLGPGSPVELLYEEKARALLIGLDIWCCTPLHLAEYRMPDPPLQLYGCVMRDGLGRHWRHFQAVQLVDEHFLEMGEWLRERLLDRREGPLGSAACYLMPIHPAVDLALDYLGRKADRRAD